MAKLLEHNITRKVCLHGLAVQENTSWVPSDVVVPGYVGFGCDTVLTALFLSMSTSYVRSWEGYERCTAVLVSEKDLGYDPVRADVRLRYCLLRHSGRSHSVGVERGQRCGSQHFFLAGDFDLE